MKILAAEDSPVTRRLMEKTLQSWGHEVVSAQSGSHAWALYQAGAFRLVISDWQMPDLDGLELCRRIRTKQVREYCYFILLTARTGKANFLEGMAAGVDDYLTKPFDTDALKVRLHVAERILALQSDVQTLRGLLPICAWCRKIRDEAQLWRSLEEYIGSHTQAEFTHSICPECTQKQLQAMADLTPDSGIAKREKP